MITMGQWTRVENSNEVFLRVTNHTGQAEKNLLGPAGIRTRDLRFTSPMLYLRFTSPMHIWKIWKKLDSVSKYQIAQVPSFDDQLPTWPVAQLVEHRTSKPKVAGSNPSRAK